MENYIFMKIAHEYSSVTIIDVKHGNMGDYQLIQLNNMVNRCLEHFACWEILNIPG